MHDIILGAFIAIISSVVTSIVTTLLSNIIQQSGKVKLYYRFVCRLWSNSDMRWGVEKTREGKTFSIPIRVEIYNTTNAPQIIRELKASLYNNTKYIDNMVPVEFIGEPDNKKSVYGDEGRYSFVIPPRSIQQYELLYSINLNTANANYDDVNHIRLTYYDSKGKKKGDYILSDENLLTKRSYDNSNWTEL